ncbi:MAG TPA: tetratricopeptide repeat protein [Blastocatellia bacterium]|nr:tetratricopeptide repeat protein [Blastocatellia bacterium]
MKRFVTILTTVFLLSILQPGLQKGYASMSKAPLAKETWLSVRSKHFQLVGNAGEKDIRRVGVRLEQFRDVFSRIFTKSKANSAIPITVIVFKNDGAFKPYKPLYKGKPASVSGYFQSGEDASYILLTSELRETNPYSVIFHEYVHALTSDNSRPLPPWLSEGIAEYYSSFEVDGDEKKVSMGKAIANHVFYLREQKFLPLQRLFAVDHGSPEYNEGDRQGVFYAQSWALVHYMLLGDGGKRQPQFIRFVNALAGGAPVDDSFKQIFQTDYAALEKELRAYIGRNSYYVQNLTFSEKLSFDADMQTAPLSEAETQYYLGDVLCRIQRREEGEEYLKRAVALDPKLAPAFASLGISSLRRNQFAEALKYLEQAVAANSRNHLAHYYYAYTLYRQVYNEREFGGGMPEDKLKLMRAALDSAIQLAPDFPEIYNLLGIIYIATGENLGAGVNALKKAMSIAPGREDYAMTLAQLYLRQEKLAEARQVVEPLARGASRPEIRSRAESLLETIAKIEQFKAQSRAATGSQTPAGSGETPAPTSSVRSGETPRPPRLTVKPRFEGEKVEGLLTHADCNRGITLTIKSAVKTVKLHAPSPERVKFISYIAGGAGEITCGPIKPAKQVVVTYQPSTDPKSQFIGEPIAVEFVKSDGKP